MADKFVNVTVNGHTFDVRVPKGSSYDFVSKAAQDYYNTKYATESGPMNPVMPPPVTKDPEFQKMEQSGGEGFWKSLGDSTGINSFKEHPLDSLISSFPQGSNFSEDPEERARQINKGFEFPGSDAFFKATHGNIRGAIGDVLPFVTSAATASPRASAAIKGVGKGIANANYPRMNISRYGLPGLLGGAADVATGGNFYRGAAIGAGGAAALKTIPPVVRSISREIPLAMGDKPWIPQIARDRLPEPGVKFSSETQPRVGGAPLPSEQKLLGPATQIQMPSSPVNNINPNPSMPGWEDEMEQARRGSSDAPVQPPNPKNPRNKYDVTKPNAGQNVPAKEHVQQVSPPLKSVKEPLPSSKEISVNPPSDSSSSSSSSSSSNPGKEAVEKLKTKNTITTSEIKEPHFSLSTMGKIAKEISTKESPIHTSDVARHIRENKLGTTDDSKFGSKDWSTKSAMNKDRQAGINAILKEAIPKFIKDNPNLF
jgi:hypothetical protein